MRLLHIRSCQDALVAGEPDPGFGNPRRQTLLRFLPAGHLIWSTCNTFIKETCSLPSFHVASDRGRQTLIVVEYSSAAYKTCSLASYSLLQGSWQTQLIPDAYRDAYLFPSLYHENFGISFRCNRVKVVMTTLSHALFPKYQNFCLPILKSRPYPSFGGSRSALHWSVHAMRLVLSFT